MHCRVSPALLALSILVVPARVAAETPDPWVPAVGRPQYFAVSVADIEKSMAWYSTAFGLRKVDEQAAQDGTWRTVDLSSADLFVELIQDRRDQAARQVRGFAKVGFGVADVDAVAERVEKATGARPRVVAMPAHRIRLIQLQDPDGNLIQLSSPLAEN